VENVVEKQDISVMVIAATGLAALFAVFGANQLGSSLAESVGTEVESSIEAGELSTFHTGGSDTPRKEHQTNQFIQFSANPAP
jgi:hypothetical protein